MQPELLKERREPQRYEAIPGNTSSSSCDKNHSFIGKIPIILSAWGVLIKIYILVGRGDNQR